MSANAWDALIDFLKNRFPYRIDSPTDTRERTISNQRLHRHIRRSLYRYRVEGSTLADIIPSFRAALFCDPSIDLAITYTDLAISDFISDIAGGVLKDILLVNTMHALWETANNIRKRNTARQILTFIGELNAGIISAEKLKEYHNKIEDPKTTEEEVPSCPPSPKMKSMGFTTQEPLMI